MVEVGEEDGPVGEFPGVGELLPAASAGCAANMAARGELDKMTAPTTAPLMRALLGVYLPPLCPLDFATAFVPFGCRA